MRSNNARARDLASRGYLVRFERAEAPSGELGFAAYVIEMPSCIAYGMTRQQAALALDRLKVDFIESLLDRGIPVPSPSNPQSRRTDVISDNYVKTQSHAEELVLQLAG